MTRRFTKILAALALLVGLTIPMGMWGQTYQQATSISVGDVVLVTTTTQTVEKELDGISSTSTPYGIATDFTTTPQGLYTLTVEAGSVSGSYALKHGNVYLSWSSGNSLTTSATKDNASSWTITFSGVNATIANVGTSTRKLVYNASSPRFACYTSSQTPIQLYKQTGGNPTCATPTFSPAAGTYTQAQNVSISCATEGATIYYTINGDEPTTNSTVYTAAINVSTNTTIKAIAAKSGYDNSTVASAVYNFVTIEHAGTEADPYTVADARTAIDANVGTQSVYATGIVSVIPTAWNTDYNNITFNFVDNAGDTDFLQAFRCVSGTGVDASTVAVGDIVVVHGNLTKYGSTYEFNQGCDLVALTHPTTPSVTVTPSTINAPFAGVEGTLTLAYENIEEFISFDYYFCDANGNALEDTDPDYPDDWIYAEINEPGEEENYTLSYIIDANDGAARTAYMKVYTYDADLEEVYAIVTVNQAKYVVDYATLPFAYDGNALAANLVPGLTQNGITDSYNNTPKIKFDDQGDYVILKINERPGILTFDIKGNGFSGGTFKVQTSEDGTTYTDLATYTNLTTTIQTEEFNNLGENVRYIKWIYTQKSSGNVALGNINLAKYVAPEPYDLTVTLGDNVTAIFVYDDPNGNPLIEEGAAGTVSVLTGTSIMISPDVAPGCVLASLVVNNENVIDQLDESGAYTFNMPSENVTISATAVEVVIANYVKVTSTDDLTSGQYLIVYEEGPLAFDGGLATLDAVGNTIEVTIHDGEINATTAAEFTIDVTEGTIKSASGYYIGQTSDANGLASSTTTAYTNTISINEGDADIVSSGGAYLRYNSDSNANRFRYYKSSTYTGQKAIQLYKKVETHTIQYSVNGVIIDALQQTSPTLVPSSLEEYESYVPNGYYFKGWIEGEEISLTQEEPNIISDIELYNPTADVTLKAVFAICDYDAINCSNYCTRAYPINGRLTNEITETDKAYYVDRGELGDQGAFVAYNDVVTINGALGNFEPNALSIQQGGELIVNNAVSVQMNEWVNGNSWCFIASPLIDEVPAENIGAFGSYSHQTYNTEDPKYNLYFYDEPTHWWRSYQNGIYAGFNIEPGTGYLYSVEQDGDQDFQYVGLIQPYVEDGIAIDLKYTATIDGEENPLAGWNLVGNPFPFTTTIDKSFYYVINNTITPAEEGTLVGPCTGAFVRAQTTGETVTFTKAENMGKSSSIGISVVGETMRGNSWANVDKAIVSFSGSQLEKFVFDADNAKLYIPQNGMDYAIVSTEAQGELPVNFRANKNGTFTLSMDVENMDMNYLHLIDNMTGMDVDLLQTPSYTFEAKVNDYESRFRLVFAANNEDGASTGSTTFAFYSNGNWIINNAGEATLQVVDLTGRILSSETVNGSVSKTINAVPGVYMLRLINGDNVNVQKIVVR